MSEIRDELTTKNLWHLMIKLSVPAILGQFVVGLYALVDSIYVGQMISTDAMSAVSAASPFFLINNGIAVLLGIGSGSILSRAIGRKDDKTVDKIMGNLGVLVLILSSIAMAVGMVFAPFFLKLAGAEGAVLEMGVAYLRTIFIGAVFVNFMQAANMVMRAEGRMAVAMAIMAGGAILNIILDPIFIKALPGYGPKAVALATVVSQLAQALFTLWYFLRKSPVVKFHGFRLAKELLPEIFKIGASAMLMQIMMLIQMTIVYNTVVKYGDSSQIAIMGAAQRVMQLSFVPIWGMSQGLQPVVGTNYGANNYNRVKRATNVFIISSTILATLAWGVVELFPAQILAAFITEPDIVLKGVLNFRIIFSLFPTYGLLIMAVTYFQALGKGKQAGLLVVFRQFALIVPLVLLLPILMGGSVIGVWSAIPINDAILFLAAGFLLLKAYQELAVIPDVSIRKE